MPAAMAQGAGDSEGLIVTSSKNGFCLMTGAILCPGQSTTSVYLRKRPHSCSFCEYQRIPVLHAPVYKRHQYVNTRMSRYCLQTLFCGVLAG